ncbi:RNA polymerase sigma-70 factor [Pedobacter hiemivivus]|uniref:RNA polymerase sigma-70 factor n=1 Tax=Pedobacter hiemivivus TaxID=2530454 RepID=A0A4R0MYR4_9SPHI|nr:RNA polymerase sigma-70 factor [Pedobacter hiemivivus]
MDLCSITVDQLDKSLLKELIILLKKSDTTAFNKVYALYRAKIHRFAWRFVRCDESAAELTQLVFVHLWKYKDSINEEKDFNAYLLTITKNLVYKEFQRKAKLAAYQLSHDKAEPDYDPIGSVMNFKDYTNLAAKAIDDLPPQTKKVFKLSRDEGASYESIAEQLNISKNTVHSHIAKSLSHIRAYFKIHTPETVLAISISLNLF